MAQPEMGMDGIAELPATWPDAPSEMTVTSLTEMELCPRRWALARAQYPNIWGGHGYPPHVSLSALTGTIVHRALETVTKGLNTAGCASVKDPSACNVLRNLGGYTAVINACIDEV